MTVTSKPVNESESRNVQSFALSALAATLKCQGPNSTMRSSADNYVSTW